MKLYIQCKGVTLNRSGRLLASGAALVLVRLRPRLVNVRKNLSLMLDVKGF